MPPVWAACVGAGGEVSLVVQRRQVSLQRQWIDPAQPARIAAHHPPSDRVRRSSGGIDRRQGIQGHETRRGRDLVAAERDRGGVRAGPERRQMLSGTESVVCFSLPSKQRSGQPADFLDPKQQAGDDVDDHTHQPAGD